MARALRACGLGKGGRVGVMMTNRPEWIAAVFGISLAGGVAVTLSTFSTSPELDYLLQSSGVSVLLFERAVPHKDFAAHADRARTEDRRFGTGCAAIGRSTRSCVGSSSVGDAVARHRARGTSS